MNETLVQTWLYSRELENIAYKIRVLIDTYFEGGAGGGPKAQLGQQLAATRKLIEDLLPQIAAENQRLGLLISTASAQGAVARG